MAKAIVSGSLLGIREHLIGLFGLFEFIFRCFITRIAIRVIFHCQLAIRLLEVFIRSIFGNTKHFIVVALGH